MSRLPDEAYGEIVRLLFREAELLDGGRYREWLSLLTEDVIYRVPVRVSKERAAGSGIIENMGHLDEDRASLEMRIARLETEFAWAEDPPSRTRHFVTNVRTAPPADEAGVDVTSNILVYRTRGDFPQFDLLSGERHDVIRKSNGSWKIARREVYLDQTTVLTHNLAIFL